MGGYKLVFNDKPSSAVRGTEFRQKEIDQSIGIGLKIKGDGTLETITWESAAFKSGMTKNTKIIAVNGIEYSIETFRDAVTEAKDPKKPVTLLLKDGKAYHSVTIDYTGGLKYPHLEKTSGGSLDVLLKAKL